MITEFENLQLTVSRNLPVNLLHSIALQYSSKVNPMVGQVEGQIPASVEKVYTFSLCVPQNTQNQGPTLKPDKIHKGDRNMPYGKDMIKKLIGFTPEEWEVICKKAKVARLRTGTYIRRISVNGEIKYYELKELVTLKRAFLSIGNNLNQIAKVANESGSVTQKDIEDMQEEFKYFRTAMQSYLFPISPTYIS